MTRASRHNLFLFRVFHEALEVVRGKLLLSRAFILGVVVVLARVLWLDDHGCSFCWSELNCSPTASGPEAHAA